MRALGWLVMGLMPVLATGCDDPFIDPFVEGKHYTIYGYLNAFDDEHFVRVVAVRRSPESIVRPGDPHAELDAIVTSTDLVTGVESRWVHSLRRLEDGRYGHVFSASFVVRKGREYQLTVTRSDGETSVARTKVPNLNNMVVAPAEIFGDSTVQTVTWIGASTPESIVVNYCAKPVGAFTCNAVPMDYGRDGRRTEEGWAVDIQLSADLDFVRQQLGYSPEIELELSALDMLFTALDDKWILPEEPINLEEFAQPDALTNVEDGYGFWGSLSRSGAAWMPDAEALAVSNYVSPGSAARSASAMSAQPTITLQPDGSLTSR